jgi:hypothetical protein
MEKAKGMDLSTGTRGSHRLRLDFFLVDVREILYIRVLDDGKNLFQAK